MSSGVVLAVLGGAASLAAILGWLGFAPNGPRILAGIKARLDAPRDIEALRKLTVSLVTLHRDLSAKQEELAKSVRDQGALLEMIEDRFRGLSASHLKVAETVNDLYNKAGTFEVSIDGLRHDGIDLTTRVDALAKEAKELGDAALSTQHGLNDFQRALANARETAQDVDNQQGSLIADLDKRLSGLEHDLSEVREGMLPPYAKQ